MASFLSRLISGKQAVEEYDEISVAPGVLFAEPRVPMTGRADHLRAPNRYSSKAVRLHNGSLVLRRDGLVVIVGHKLRCHATFADAPDAWLSIDIRREGILIGVDVVGAFPPKGAGKLTLEIKTVIPDEVLTQLPSRELRATVPPEDLLSMTRWS